MNAIKRRRMIRAQTQLAMTQAVADQTFDAVITAIGYLTPHDERRKDAWKLMIEFFGADTQVGDITIPDAIAFYEWLSDKGMKYRTVERLRWPCKQLWDWCNAAGICSTNPIDAAKLDHRKFSHKQLEPHVRRALTQEEFERLVSYLDSHKIYRRKPHFRQSAAIGYYTGMRWGDVKNMKWDSFQEGHIIVHTRKVMRRIAIPINHPALGGGRLVELLADLQFDPDMDYVFPALAEAKSPLDWKRYFVRAGIKDADGFYSLRHAFVTRLKANGLTLEEIATYVGHSSTKMTMNYSH